MTILVLELHVPGPGTGLGLSAGLVHLAPKVASYAVSFIILGTLWVGHHDQFHDMRRSGRALLWINILFMLFVSFLPFSTALVGSYPGERPAVLFYGATLMGAGLCLLAEWSYAAGRGRLLESGTLPEVVRAIRSRVLAGTAFYGAALAIATFHAGAAQVLFAVMPLLYLVPTRIDRHVKAA
jgi:uncharacterized membrane protein